MSSKKNKKKSSRAASQQSTPASNNKLLWGIGAAIIVGAIAIVIALNGGKSAQSGAGAASVPAEEQKYLGRFLPAGYSEASVASATTYSSTIKMTPLEAVSDASGLSLKLSDIVSNKIVSFKAQRNGQPLSMIAYVKPSGKLFVGVSYCPPCKGEGQRIEADGSLTCETCGTKRSLEGDTGISGACKLYPLDEMPVTVTGDTVTVAQSAIDGWSEQPLDRPVGQ